MHETSSNGLPIGLAVMRPSPSAMVEAVVRAEEGGLPTVWSTVAGAAPDAVTTLAIAAAQTKRIAVGTAIVPVYPRHPIVLASQALVFEDVAPGRLRLGIGSSHRPTVEGVFGLSMRRPLEYVREYATVLRQLLWEGHAAFEGEFFRVHAELPPGATPPRTPILLSALRPNAYRQAGEIADGAISWLCPLHYLSDEALPALQAGAERAGRSRPPLVAHVPVALTSDEDRALQAGREMLTRYARLPFYAAMFARAGHPIPEDQSVPDGLVHDLVVSGTTSQVMDRLRQALASGPDELLVTLLPVGDPETLDTEFIQGVKSARKGDPA